jgi:hypothetical protein
LVIAIKALRWLFVGSRTTQFQARSSNLRQDCSKQRSYRPYLTAMLSNCSRRVTEILETNAGKPWDTRDLFFLVSAVERGMTVEEVAGFLRRPASEVQEKVRELQARSRRRALQWKKATGG